VYRPTTDPDIVATLSQPASRSLGWRAVGRNVWLLGFTSLVTDMSAEMVASVLPMYLMFHLQLSPAAVGLVEGLHQGGASIARVASGLLADNFRRYKEVAVVGYLTSALCRIGLLLVGSSTGGIAAITLIDRAGKGTRTPARDALISLSAPARGLGAAFGVHRALDTIGAMLGPVLAVALLRWAPARLQRRIRRELLAGVDWRRNPGDVRQESATGCRCRWRTLFLARHPHAAGG
jgi:nitrate/nitrite transporter NarK